MVGVLCGGCVHGWGCSVYVLCGCHTSCMCVCVGGCFVCGGLNGGRGAEKQIGRVVAFGKKFSEIGLIFFRDPNLCLGHWAINNPWYVQISKFSNIF